MNNIWRKTRTVVVANPKGSAGKTPTTANIGAAFGDVRGGGVCAWDNNETMGTLGQRTVPARFNTTVLDLLANLSQFERIDAKKGELSGFMRPQESGQYHVLASDDDPAQMIQIGAEEFARIHTVLTRYYDVLVVDTGNNSRAENFVAAIDAADALVIPTRWSEDCVTRAGKLVDQLRASGHGDLVERAVTVVTGPPATEATADDIRTWRAWFTETTAAVVDIPMDKHIGGGGPIVHEHLAPAARRAYLSVAARVAEQFTAAEEASAFRSIKEKSA
ncbi:MinD/ParA family ATP-binding protein [Isoptericola rhizosphaerae]|uniref:MinD/ParA family ATP-binding protein n=1 Tax=Isoptericola rhizosphaerae TaxID=3377837 RepID=UPI00383AA349